MHNITGVCDKNTFVIIPRWRKEVNTFYGYVKLSFYPCVKAYLYENMYVVSSDGS